MTHQIVTKEHMEALQLLAQTNLKISTAKNSLFKLQEDETIYLTEREKKALARIQKIFDDSEEILTKTKTNYSEVKDLLRYASELATFITEAQENFSQMLKDFEERDSLWLADVARREEELATILKNLQIDQVIINNEKKNIARDKAIIAQDYRKIDDKWEEIKREIKRLKEKEK